MEYADEMKGAEWRNVLFVDEKSFWLDTTVTQLAKGRRKENYKNLSMDKKATRVRRSWLLS